jgi:zinc D-Ala-D-Ala carboxypeptidase
MNYFDIKEFDCKCCGQNKMNQGFLEKLDEARRIAQVPFVINSGYRCPAHNAAVGSTSENHTLGRAADIDITSGNHRLKVLQGLFKVGFKRIGIAKTFIHVDNMDEIGALESCWFY